MGVICVVVVKMVALIVSLGMDTLMVSISLGTTAPRRSTRIRLAVAFASAEALMPLIGIGLGHELGQVFGRWSSLAGAVALLVVGAWFVFWDRDSGRESETGSGTLTIWTTAVLALSISIDELAAGFSMGILGIPIALTIILIGCEAFVFTLTGLFLGRWFKLFLGPWAEKVAGAVLGCLGFFLLVHVGLGLP
jgi:putative Mn2+ efflux pump MntP